jgi:hypothetical protein
MPIHSRVLRTAIGVMDAPSWRPARGDGGSQRGKRQTRIDPFADCIADNSP